MKFRIYPKKCGKYDYYSLNWRELGKNRSKTLKSVHKAKEMARKISQARVTGEVILTPSEAVEWREWKKGSVRASTVTVKEAIDKFLEDGTNRLRWSQHTLAEHKRKLYLFESRHSVPLSQVTHKDINRFIQSLNNFEVRTRNGILGIIMRLFRFASDNGWVSPMQSVRRERVDHKMPGIYTVKQMEDIITKWPNKALLYPVLGGFYGIRVKESGLVTKEHIRQKGIVLSADVTKKSQQRSISFTHAWEPELIEKLIDWVIRYTAVASATYRIGRDCNTTSIPNGFRHSWCSYKLAVAKNVDDVTFEAGHSKSVMFSHYLNLVSEEDGHAWFDLMYKLKERVLPPS